MPNSSATLLAFVCLSPVSIIGSKFRAFRLCIVDFASALMLSFKAMNPQYLPPIATKTLRFLTQGSWKITPCFAKSLALPIKIWPFSYSNPKPASSFNLPLAFS